MICCFCRKKVSDDEPVMFAVSGFEMPRKSGGSNSIHLRKRTGAVAHPECVEKQKPSRREARLF